MDLRITRHGLQLIPTNRPVDDIIIEENLGLCAEGDSIKLVRVSGSKVFSKREFLPEAPPPYILEAELPPIEKEDEVNESRVVLPCPFCGAIPEMQFNRGPESFYGRIVCTNPHCPVQPKTIDGRKIIGAEDPESTEALLITLWNRRFKC